MKKDNLVFMHGEDAFSLQQELDRWKHAFVRKHGDSNLEELDGTNVKPPTISESIRTLPFLGEKRLVILKNFLKHQKAEVSKELVPLLEKLSDSTVFLVAEFGDPDKRSALYKKLTQIATIRLFLAPKGTQLSTWIQRRAETHQAQIDFRSANILGNLLGEDLWSLENEIQKLSLFARGQAITPEMIDQIVTGLIEQSIFTLTDQLAHKNTSGALRTIRMLQDQGHGGPYLFAMIVRQFRLMLEMKSLGEEGKGQPEIARLMAVHPFVVKKTLGYCKNFTSSKLKAALRELLEVERRLKTGLIHLRPREEEQYLLAIERVLISKKTPVFS